MKVDRDSRFYTRAYLLGVALFFALAHIPEPAQAQSVEVAGYIIKCSDISKLTSPERRYLIWRFEISRPKQLEIRVVCKLDNQRKG